jgi:hypothetical protein
VKLFNVLVAPTLIVIHMKFVAGAYSIILKNTELSGVGNLAWRGSLVLPDSLLKIIQKLAASHGFKRV